MSATENKIATQGNLRPWKPGQSGNPGGRPKGNAALRQRCRDLTEQAIAALLEALSEPGERVQAAKVLLAYGYGAPESKPVVDEDEPDESSKVSPETALKLLLARTTKSEPTDEH